MMVLAQTARAALRTATAVYHDRVDAVFSTADLADRRGYGGFLRAQAAAHLPVEAALEHAGVTRLLPDWSARRRAALLRADLAALDLAVPEAAGEIAFADDAAVLGGVYVLEGSRLGGAMLARGVPAEFPSGFLASGDSAAWRRLIGLLDHRLLSAAERSSAIEAASRVFLLFEDSGLRFLKADCVGRI